jgi:predicted HTH domain antitoxin
MFFPSAGNVYLPSAGTAFTESAMETFSVRDLRERTDDLVRQAEAGHISLVAKQGHPLFVTVPLDDHLLEHGVAVALACRLFAEKAISLNKAARLAGLPVEAFVQQLGTLGVPTVDYPREEIDGELEGANA